MASQLREVGISHLPVPDDSAEFDICERHSVLPELVTFRVLDAVDNVLGCRCGSTRPHEETNQAALSNRASREPRVEVR